MARGFLEGGPMKRTLSFQFDDDEEARLTTIVKAEDYRRALVEIMNVVFRPARKHGYSGSDWRSHVADLEILTGPDAKAMEPSEVVGMLERAVWAIINEYELEVE
jgi:hypothetical protein